MKKILLILCLIPFGVSASTLTQDDNYERRYKYYKVEKELGSYESENISNQDYPLIDYNDYIYTDYSEWSSLEKEGEREEKTVYKYSSPLDTNKIILSDFANDFHYVDVSAIRVYYDGEEIPYSLTCTLCENDFGEKLSEGLARINVNGTITLNLEENYESQKLNVDVDFISQNEWVTWIGAKYLNDDIITLKSNMILRKHVVGPATLNVIGENLDVVNEDKIIYKDEFEENEFYLGEEIWYRYREKLYQKYKEVKIYTDYLNYVPFDYIKDETMYKDYYINTISETVFKNEDSIQVVDNPVKTSSSEPLVFTNENEITSENIITKAPSTSSFKIKNQNTESYDNSYFYVFYILIFLIVLKFVLSKLKKSSFVETVS